ncbi:hypothetical protein CCH79_00018576 [Gambusia affinis]|uniref:Uncharacterized protein n=1 Tax=Gambusia affinis TaxID=33528 RepID=A0A315VY15_GAMAF|nr:hypothetical protein CCH79_00018576 [Gambusia affinis]
MSGRLCFHLQRENNFNPDRLSVDGQRRIHTWSQNASIAFSAAAELWLAPSRQQPSPQQVEDFLNKEDFSDSSSRRSSANSLFLKAMDGRPRRRRSIYSRATRAAGGPQSPDPPNGRRSSTKEPSTLEMDGAAHPSEGNALRRPSATELLLTPLKQFVAQSQKALEYLSPNSSDGAAIVTETDDS